MRWKIFASRLLQLPRSCATGTNWSCRSQSWSPGTSSGSMPGTWYLPTPAYWTPRTCTSASPRSRGSVCPSTRRRMIFQRGNTALPTPATAFSWALLFRRESAPQSSFAPAKTPLSARLHNGWPRGRRKPNSAFGEIAQRLATRPPETEFGRGIRHFGLMITRVIMLLVLFVLLVNVVLHRPFLESFLFSVALAVGMTPEMMPMIITITLAQGARRMARKTELVKQLSAIEDFGSVEILCSDKTGTLTEGEIVLDRHVDIHGQDSEDVLRFVYLN